MLRSFIEHHVRIGMWTMDIVIAKCLAVVLIASLGCRSGDVCQSNDYHEDEYLQWRHIELYLPAQTSPTEKLNFYDLRARVTLEFTKGKKQATGDDLIRYLRPLEDADSIHVCPVALMVCHALRNGLVHGRTVEDLLHHTASQTDRHVVWIYPDRPVMTAIARKPSRCDLDVVTTPTKVCTIVKEMGLISGMISRAYTHALRLGAIRDYSHLDRSTLGKTSSTDDIRRYAGHSHGSMHKGVTEGYAGDAVEYVYNNRAMDGGVDHHREPRFAVDAQAAIDITRPVTSEEIQSDIDSRLPGRTFESLTNIEKKTSTNRIRRRRQEEWAKVAEAEPITHEKSVMKRRGAAPPPALTMERPKEQESIFRQPALPTKRGKKPAALAPASSAQSTGRELVAFSSLNNGTKDDKTLALVEVADEDLKTLQSTIMGTGSNESALEKGLTGIASTTAMEDYAEEAAHLFLDQGDSDSLTESSKAMLWMNSYARYNVVNNTDFANNWAAFTEDKTSFESTIGPHCLRGNSRDEPTPFFFCCTKTEGCTYKNIKFRMLEQHEHSCNEAMLAELEQRDKATLTCTVVGCKFSTTGGELSLKSHITRAHSWIPITCDKCPDSKKIFDSHGSWEAHQIEIHSGRWPVKCVFPGCTSDTPYKSAKALTYHLRTGHSLSEVEQRLPYMPPRPEKRMWIPQACFMPKCSNKTVFRTPSRMSQHVEHAHHVSPDDAPVLMERDATWKTFVPASRVLGSGPNAKRTNNKRTFVDSDDEDVAPADSKDIPKKRKTKSKKVEEVL